MHDPKRFMNYATAYIDSTPGRHTQGSYGNKPASGLETPAYDSKSVAGRGPANKMGSDLMHMISCAGMCMFGLGFMDASALTDFINLTTGWNCTMNDLLKIGDRTANMRQAFNIREGIGIVDFNIPGRLSGNPPPTAGPTAGRSVDFTTLRNDLLAARDWDINTSKPSKNKLLELGLDDVATGFMGLTLDAEILTNLTFCYLIW